MKKNISVAVIGTVGLPATYGGWETLVDNLVKKLSRKIDFTVYCSRPRYQTFPREYNSAKLVYLNLDANGVQSIFYDLQGMIHSMRSSDVLLVLGVSGCFFLPFIKPFSSAKVIVNIDGMEWRRAKWGRFAKWFLKLSERFAVKWADLVISDNKVIKDYVYSTYSKQSVMIPYGGDQSDSVAPRPVNMPSLSERYAFKVCRIEPENNVEIILSAFAKHGELDLVVVGNWNNSEYGRSLRKRFSTISNLHLLDPIYEITALNALRANASLYVHGHSAGGTNPSLVEAMNLGLPIFVYNCNFNLETTENSCPSFCNDEELVSLISCASSDSLEVLGKRMKDIASSRYTWDVVSEQYLELFQGSRL